MPGEIPSLVIGAGEDHWHRCHCEVMPPDVESKSVQQQMHGMAIARYVSYAEITLPVKSTVSCHLLSTSSQPRHPPFFESTPTLYTYVGKDGQKAQICV